MKGPKKCVSFRCTGVLAASVLKKSFGHCHCVVVPGICEFVNKKCSAPVYHGLSRRFGYQDPTVFPPELTLSYSSFTFPVSFPLWLPFLFSSLSPLLCFHCLLPYLYSTTLSVSHPYTSPFKPGLQDFILNTCYLQSSLINLYLTV